MKETIVIIAENCPHCGELLKTLPKDKVRILDVTKDLEGARIMRDLNIYRVPLLVIREKTEQGEEHLCTLDEKEGKVKCVKGSEVET